MSRAGDPPVRNEGRRGSRIDFDEGRGYHGIPPQSSIRAFPSVQRIGCGTPFLIKARSALPYRAEMMNVNERRRPHRSAAQFATQSQPRPVASCLAVLTLPDEMLNPQS